MLRQLKRKVPQEGARAYLLPKHTRSTVMPGTQALRLGTRQQRRGTVLMEPQGQLSRSMLRPGIRACRPPQHSRRTAPPGLQLARQLSTGHMQNMPLFTTTPRAQRLMRLQARCCRRRTAARQRCRRMRTLPPTRMLTTMRSRPRGGTGSTPRCRRRGRHPRVLAGCRRHPGTRRTRHMPHGLRLRGAATHCQGTRRGPRGSECQTDCAGSNGQSSARLVVVRVMGVSSVSYGKTYAYRSHAVFMACEGSLV